MKFIIEKGKGLLWAIVFWGVLVGFLWGIAEVSTRLGLVEDVEYPDNNNGEIDPSLDVHQQYGGR